MSFDELNVVRISKELKDTYKRLMEYNRKGYTEIVEEAHLYAISLLTEEEKAEIMKICEEKLEAYYKRIS